MSPLPSALSSYHHQHPHQKHRWHLQTQQEQQSHHHHPEQHHKRQPHQGTEEATSKTIRAVYLFASCTFLRGGSGSSSSSSSSGAHYASCHSRLAVEEPQVIEPVSDPKVSRFQSQPGAPTATIKTAEDVHAVHRFGPGGTVPTACSRRGAAWSDLLPHIALRGRHSSTHAVSCSYM